MTNNVLILKIFYYAVATAFVFTGHPYFAIYCFIAGAFVRDDNYKPIEVETFPSWGRTTSPTGTIDTPPPNTSGSDNNPFRKYG